MRTTALVVGVLTVGIALGGCAAPAPVKDPITLTMYHVDGGPGLDPAVEWFVESVSDLSEGTIEIDVEYACCGRENDVEEQLLGAVADGDVDLGWVGTRVLKDLGVGELAALTAPLVVDSYRLQQEVIESDAATAALASVESLGVVAIGLAPGSNRLPLSTAGPIVAVADWRGVTVASFHSRQNTESFQALGAEPLDVGYDERDQGLLDGSIGVLENSLLMLDADREGILPYATVNVVLWPRASAIVANPAIVDRLGTEGLALLRQAAQVVAARTPELLDLDAAALESACHSGARFSLATQAELAGLAESFAGVYDRLAADDDTSPLYSAILALKPTIDPQPAHTIPAGCSGDVLDASPPASGDVSALNGTFRGPEFTVASLIDAGFDAADADAVAGTFTFIFTDGKFELVHNWHGGEIYGCIGSYSVADDHIVVDYLPGGDCGSGGQLFNADFAVSIDQLVLSNFSGADLDTFLFSSQPWGHVD